MNHDFLTSAFTHFRASLRTVAAAIAGTDSADDILHDAFCRLWSGHIMVRSEAEARRLSYTAVRNSAIDSLRRQAAHPTVSLDVSGPIAAESSEPPDDVYQAVINISRRALSPRHYEIFRLHDIEGIGYDEIALSMGMSVENVRMTLSRARKTIRQIYRQQNPDK